MEMFKLNNSGTDNISVEVNLKVALEEIDKLPLLVGESQSHIGFTNDKSETIQFVRFEEGWMLDVPVVENGGYGHNLQDFIESTEKVKEIVTKFFLNEDWKSLCKLEKDKFQK